MKLTVSNNVILIATEWPSDEAPSSDWVPFAVLLTCHAPILLNCSSKRALVERLLVSGTKAFVCVGDFSEPWHDIIDDWIEAFDQQHGTDKSNTVITTFHTDESLEDTVNFFVCGTEKSIETPGGLLVIADPDTPAFNAHLAATLQQA